MPLRICFVSSEVAPLAKSGGLGDVSAALPRFLHGDGHDVRVFLPFYSVIDTRELVLYPVEFIRNVEIPFGGRSLRFTAYTTRLPGSDLAVYPIHCPELYDRPSLYTFDPDEHLRFAMLSRAAIASCQHMGFSPEVVHCNDWHAALIPLYLRSVYAWDWLFRRTKTLLTIHNIGYQGVFSAGTIAELGLGGHERRLDPDDLRQGRINFLKTGILHADAVTTVSPTYAREIQTDAYGMGLAGLLRARRQSVVGILNGVDYGEWDPRTDVHLPVPYSIDDLSGKHRNKELLLAELGLPHESGVPVIGMVTRLTVQKGVDLLFDALPGALRKHDFRLVVLGSGDPKYEQFFEGLQASLPSRVRFYRGYHNALAHRIEAACDMFLMPSQYEPCGLNQMFSLRYGTVPIVRRTGGLADSVEPYDPAAGSGTGFVFEPFTPEALQSALEQALATYRDAAAWRQLMRRGMSRDFSWPAQGRRYVELYERLRGG
jgi:starch synthase